MKKNISGIALRLFTLFMLYSSPIEFFLRFYLKNKLGPSVVGVGAGTYAFKKINEKTVSPDRGIPLSLVAINGNGQTVYDSVKNQQEYIKRRNQQINNAPYGVRHLVKFTNWIFEKTTELILK